MTPINTKPCLLVGDEVIIYYGPNESKKMVGVIKYINPKYAIAIIISGGFYSIIGDKDNFELMSRQVKPKAKIS